MIIISPSKRQADPVYKQGLDRPPFLQETQNLVDSLSTLSKAELASVLGVSSTLAMAAYQNYQALVPFPEESMEAIYLYRGDVFKYLDVDTLSETELQYLEENLGIISPLYGLISPMTGIWPYRLEMVSKIPGCHRLREHWSCMQKIVDKKSPKFIFNLASNEYSSCIKAPKGSQWVDIVFEDKSSNGRYRVIAVKAKRMRGEVLRYMVKNSLKSPEELYNFKHKDYEYNKEISTSTRIVFRSK